MTRKDYVAIAEGFKQELDYWSAENKDEHASMAQARMALRSQAQRIARVFESDNARFDRARFLRACGF